MIICPKCTKENQDHYKFCLGCGAELPRDGSAKAFSPRATPAQGVKSVQMAAAVPQPAVVPAQQVPVTFTPSVPQPVAAPIPTYGSSQSVAVASTSGACPTCGHINTPANRFCASCGTVLAPTTGASAHTASAPSASSMQVTLTALRADGSDAGVFQLHEGHHIIGRETGSIFGADSYLSPKHVSFQISTNSVIVKDENSVNGVYIKILRDRPVELQSGDMFRIGQEILCFQKLMFPLPDPNGVEHFGSPTDGALGRLLLVVGRESTANAFVIPSYGVHLGRERGEIVFPEDGYVSGLHCRVASESGRIFLTDLGSSNGTYVRLREEHHVHSGDVLLMGQQLFRVNF